MIWTKKYEPKNSQEIVGHEKEIELFKELIKTPKKNKKGIILYGSPGNGKTSMVYAIANELNYEIIEINGSDYRNAYALNEIIGGASQQRSLFMKNKIILIDEVDCFSGRKDRGAVKTIIKLMEKSIFPFVMTANNPFDKNLKPLVKKSEMIELKILNYKSVFEILKKITLNENINIEDEILTTLARRSGGDLRGAILDLQTITVDKEIDKKSLDELDGRERKDNIFNALIKIFKSKDPKIVINSLRYIDEDLEKVMLWIEHNLPREYTKHSDLYNGFEQLSIADVFKGRIRRRQYYRYYVYMNYLLTVGIALSKKEKYQNIITYEQTNRILKIWMANMKNQKKKLIAEKIARVCHTNKYNVLKDFYYYKTIIKSNRFKETINEFELNKEEISWITK